MKKPAEEEVKIPDDTEVEFASIEAQLEEKFNGEFLKMLKRLVYEVAIVGMSEKEACVLVNYDYVKLIALKEKDELVQRLFDMKTLEYKRGLMKTMSDKARKGDEKLAQWLLEAKYPNEFNRRKGVGSGGGDDGEDLLGAAVEFIQKSTAPSGLIKETSGRAFLVKKAGESKKAAPMSIHDNLVGRAHSIVKELEEGNG